MEYKDYSFYICDHSVGYPLASVFKKLFSIFSSILLCFFGIFLLAHKADSFFLCINLSWLLNVVTLTFVFLVPIDTIGWLWVYCQYLTFLWDRLLNDFYKSQLCIWTFSAKYSNILGILLKFILIDFPSSCISEFIQ